MREGEGRERKIEGDRGGEADRVRGEEKYRVGMEKRDSQVCKCAGISGNFCPVVGGVKKAQTVTLASPTAPRGHNNNNTT